MKLFVFAALVATASADDSATDTVPVHTVYNCHKVRQDVQDANDILGDGVCDNEVNCGPFSYDLGDCWESEEDICEDTADWYTTGKPNFRCSTKTGGIRLGRDGSNDLAGVATPAEWDGPCSCYAACQDIAAAANETLVAFDMYSDKCRCWGGVCTVEDSLPCFNGGDEAESGGSPKAGGNGDPDAGNNWRCPAQIYFPHPMEDCDGRDITYAYSNLAQYIGDGFCDDGSTLNQDFAFFSVGTPPFNFNCEAFEYDGGDCKLDCHESIYWATDFVDLNRPMYEIDTCVSDAAAVTNFTTACACYEFCAMHAAEPDTEFLFDHSDSDMCRCFFEVNGHGATIAELTSDDERFCGLNSNCQIYQPNRFASCNHSGTVDFTLGVYDEGDAYDAENIGDEVQSYSEYISSMCVESAMCPENSYSMGSCFDCERFSTDKQTDRYCTDDTSIYAQISNADLDDLIADGVLMGQEAVDISTADDNCACLNYCFSQTVEMAEGDSDTVYDLLNVIAAFDIAYAIRDDSCTCYGDCSETTACDATCSGGETVWYSTVADLNVQE